MNGTEKLKELINGSNNIVFFGGAGVSTESGIPDFRSTDGLYHQEYDYPPETILSHSFFMRNPEEFYRFYKNKMLCLDAKPNMAAGSKEVLELHGSVHRNYCMKCGKSYDAEYMLHAEGVPTCSCGGRIKPDVVLYEEGLDMTVMARAIQAIQDADMLIIGGTSLIVYPAAGLIDYYRGNKLVVINMSVTSQDKNADLVIQEPIGKVFAGI